MTNQLAANSSTVSTGKIGDAFASLMGLLIGLVIVAISTAVTVVLPAILQGYVMSILWSWFVVPLFSVPQVSIPMAIGLATLVRYLMSYMPAVSRTEFKKISQRKTEKEKLRKPPIKLFSFGGLTLTRERKTFGDALYWLFAAFAPSAFALLLGWALHSWFM